jgi:GAF domain-containing protein
MKVGGTVMGRLWVVGEPGRPFTRAEREFATMAGNQLALAMENSRLYDEVQLLATRRGKLLRQVIATQDERCRRISRGLHDEISQPPASMALNLKAAQVAGRA